MLKGCFESHKFHLIVMISNTIVIKYMVISFINLLDTSATWVDIFWMSLYLAKETVQECIVFVDNEMYVLIHGDFIILCICT